MYLKYNLYYIYRYKRIQNEEYVTKYLLYKYNKSIHISYISKYFIF